MIASRQPGARCRSPKIGGPSMRPCRRHDHRQWRLRQNADGCGLDRARDQYRSDRGRNRGHQSLKVAEQRIDPPPAVAVSAVRPLTRPAGCALEAAALPSSCRRSSGRCPRRSMCAGWSRCWAPRPAAIRWQRSRRLGFSVNELTINAPTGRALPRARTCRTATARAPARGRRRSRRTCMAG